MTDPLTGGDLLAEGAPSPLRGARWRVLRRTVLVVLYGLLGPVALFVALAWWWFEPFPVWFRWTLVLCWPVLLILAGLHRRRHLLTTLAVAGGLTLVIAGWYLQVPVVLADVAPDLEFAPLAILDGDHLVVRHVRQARYWTADRYDVSWDTRVYDLSTLRGAELIVVPFGTGGPVAHTFMTFAFADGEHLAISFEVGRRTGETYNPLAGCFHRYLLRCVVGDERDLIGRRLLIDKDPVYLFPLRLPAGGAAVLLQHLLARANALTQRPEFYDTLGNSCLSNLVDCYELLTGKDLGWDWRRWMPGHADALAQDLGLIDASEHIDVLRERYRVRGDTSIDAVSRANGTFWSAKIRGRFTE